MTTHQHQHEHRGHGEHEGLPWGHSWREEDRVTEYVERMDRQQDERQVVFELLARLVQAEADAPLRILDIGAGYGPVATACLDAFPNATAVGLDISEAMIEAGKPRMARFGERFAYVHGDFADGVLPPHVIAARPVRPRRLRARHPPPPRRADSEPLRERPRRAQPGRRVLQPRHRVAGDGVHQPG